MLHFVKYLLRSGMTTLIEWFERLAPAALLAVCWRHYQRRVMGCCGVSVDCGGGLGAQVAGFGVEIDGADTVAALSAVKLHATFDALDFVGFH
jgi:hypothetical protein